jgi:hypothetical protein
MNICVEHAYSENSKLEILQDLKLSINMISQMENSIVKIHSQNASTLKFCIKLPSACVTRVYVK